MMKPFFSLALTLAMLTFSGCSGQSTIPEATPAQLTQLYTQAITSQDSQITQSIPVFSQFTRESTPLLDSLDLEENASVETTEQKETEHLTDFHTERYSLRHRRHHARPG